MRSYHPAANGLVERFHRQLKSALKAQDDPQHWHEYLPIVLLGIRTTVKEDLTCSPAELVYGTSLRLPERTILVTADVKSLYTNIPHNEGIQACKNTLNSRQRLHPPTDQLIRLLELVLTLNNFKFQEQHYIQIQGTAMGTPLAPSYANIFMGELETDILTNSRHAIIAGSWKRYIDDIQFMWSGSPRLLAKFQDTINTRHSTIKYTFESSNSEVCFLDTLLQLKNGTLHTELYNKPTDTHSYLLPTSCHPKHTFRSIPFSQATRVRRICSGDDSRKYHLTKLETHLTRRQYDTNLVTEQIQKASIIPREQLLIKNKKQSSTNIHFSVTYTPGTSTIPSIIHKHYPLIEQSDTLKTIFHRAPMTSFRRSKR
ncbi:uncharacterized protein LOC135155276 [Lytechinus pictus]|uniref:uncharacterized protein LOC135155276 n=1 Tax=Lytechinus pictus TaxID=7653 RepID=UPI0030B9C09B